MKEPNIFHFATSELSQDAFLAWLIAWWPYRDHPTLRRAAGDFIISLYNLYGDTKLSAEAVSAVNELKAQRDSIDVYFEAVIQGKPVSFIIEDKTYTTPHSNQLERYRQAICAEKPGREIVCVYYKTGYLLPEDERALAAAEQAGARYAVIDSKWMCGLLGRHEVDHPIYTNYRQYLEEEFVKPVEEIDHRLFGNNEYEQFKEQAYQVEFLQALARSCRTSINQEGYITSDVNTGGTPRSQYWFVRYEKLFGEYDEHLNYRLDRRRNPETGEAGFYLRLSQYGWVDQNPEGQKTKQARLETYRQLFKAAVEHNTALALSELGNRGLHETEVGILFFNKKNNTVKNVLEGMPKAHDAFLRGVVAAFGGTAVESQNP